MKQLAKTASEGDACSPTANIVITPRKILLGETKYYTAKPDPNQEGKLIITESSSPDLGDGDARVVLEDPEIADDAVNNDKIGVYWDYCTPDGDGLDDGVIRLIGKYWKSDTLYKVKLHAVIKELGIEGTIDIDVKKPLKLGITFNSITDVFGTYGHPNLNLDELIIKYAGENGIPPQLIKGQIEQESSFEPKWRYEPFQDIQKQSDDNIFQNNKFVITENSMGGDFPSTHTNVQPFDYQRIQIKISDYLIEKWSDVYVQKGETINDPDIILGSESEQSGNLTKLWKDEWKKIRDKVGYPKETTHNYIKSLVADASSDVGKMFDRLAQNRIFSSYGFTQMLYSTAITDSSAFFFPMARRSRSASPSE